MQEYPPKLLKKISHLSEDEQDLAKDRFLELLSFAEEQQLQSPRFWAMRQVIANRSDREIQKKVKKRQRSSKEPLSE